MSKIGKKPISIPSGVTLTIQNGAVAAKGPKGELKREFPADFEVVVNGQEVLIRPAQGSPGDSRLWGLYRALLRNMLIGVAEGFTETLEMDGVGYKAVPKGADLELNLGFSHPILYKAPAGIAFKVEKNVITITGTDKEAVGKAASEIRALKLPEPYKGHGVKYTGEVIRRKAGKKAVASGA